MTTSTAPTTEALTALVRQRARAEAREIVAMLDYRDAEMARTAHLEPAMRRQVERSAIALTIGEAMTLSEGQVAVRLSQADTVRDHSPITWAAFMAGHIDLGRVREIAGTIDQLRRADSIHRLDQLALPYATTHTLAELRQWLRRFVQRVEADLATERAQTARTQRRVQVKHGDDSMSWLHAYLPSHQAAAIEHRLHREARRPTHQPDDQHTVAQREADLLVAWCTDSEATDTTTDAHIAVTIDADVLAGATTGFAESSDHRWAVPASWITDLALTGNTFWHRIVLDPVRGDVLSHEYLGRFAPTVLAKALSFRDHVCQAPGCMVPAEHCDIDHRIAYPEGPTTASNLGPLCRRHHSLKGHGLLHWSTRPTHHRPPIILEIYPHPVHFEYAA